MADTFERIAVPDNLLDRLETLEAQVRALQRRNTEAETLSEIAGTLGEIGDGQVTNLMSSTAMLQYAIQEGISITVPDRYAYLVPGYLEVYGQLTVEGKVFVL